MNNEFEERISDIIGLIRSAGYDPYAQLVGFVQTHDQRYITRQGNARGLILELDIDLVKQYVRRLDQL